jgi:hypothetical protein
MKRPLCLLFGHKYLRLRYPGSPDGYFLRCDRCGHERDEPGGGSQVGRGMLN